VPTQRLKYRPALRLSPDGRRLAVTIATLTEAALWTANITRGSLTKVSVGGEADSPRWTPDAQRIAFYLLRDGVPHVAWQRVDGSAGPDTLVAEGGWPSSWSPDGRHLATVKDSDIWMLTVGDRQPAFMRVTTTPEEERSPEFSPNGRSLAYVSDKTGRFEVYVRPYPESGPSTLVSIAGGSDPAWNPKGGDLFFLEPIPSAPGEYRMMAVSIVGQQPGTPRPLFTFRATDLYAQCAPARCLT
jgi:serine/threonine-protein kinase